MHALNTTTLLEFKRDTYYMESGEPVPNQTEEDMLYDLSTYLFDNPSGEEYERMRDFFGKEVANKVLTLFFNGRHDT